MAEEEKLFKQIEKIETILSTTLSKITDRDSIIKKKDERITELTDKLLQSSKDKEDIIKARLELMESYSKEREEKNQLQKALNEQKKKIETLKEGKKLAQDTVMGSSFEQDRLQKEVLEKEQKLKEIEQKVSTIASGSTGIFFNMEDTVAYLKDRIKAANRTLRLVVPTFDFLEQHEFLELLNDLPESAVVNIATSFDLLKNGDTIEKWKIKRYNLFDFKEENLITISANGGDVGVASIKGANISGFHTNIPDLVQIFNQSVMHAFIKGKKF